LTLVDYSRLYEAAAPSVVAVVSYTRDDVTGEPGLLRWGTGFVADEKGLIFTNAHVVERAALVTILFADGRSYSVKASPPGLLVDKLSDLALVDLAASLEAGGESISVKALPLGDSDRVAVGQPVLAIGNPATMRLRNTLTAGIVSGVGRGLGGFYSFIQTDAAINPGSSGGPLLNLRGEVIGITSMKFVDASLEGLAFAIPINTAQAIARELAQSGRVSRPWLGVVIEESWEARIGLPSANGLYVGAVETGSPAGAAGLIAGDFITGVDDRPVRSVQELNDALISHKVGEILKLTVWRPAGTMVIPVVLMERPAYLDG
jgi:S1-C subfamily serine protease